MRRGGRSRGACLLVVGARGGEPGRRSRRSRSAIPRSSCAPRFAIGAVLAAAREQTLLAAVLLGLAIATKAWAVLAIGPVLLALPGRRLLALAVAGTVCAVIVAPLMLAGAAATRRPRRPHDRRDLPPVADLVAARRRDQPRRQRRASSEGARAAPAWLSPLTHPLIALLVVPLSLLYWWRNRGKPAGEQVLALLALLLLLRCILDPWNTVYYELPFLLALLSWEALCRPSRPPVLTLGATLATWVTFVYLRAPAPRPAVCALLAWSLPLAAWLARETFAPHAGLRLRSAPARTEPRLRLTTWRYAPRPRAPRRRGSSNGWLNGWILRRSASTRGIVRPVMCRTTEAETVDRHR